MKYVAFIFKSNHKSSWFVRLSLAGADEKQVKYITNVKLFH